MKPVHSALSGALKPHSRYFTQGLGDQKAPRGNHLAGEVLNESFVTLMETHSDCTVTSCAGRRGFPGALPWLLGVSGFGFSREALKSMVYTRLWSQEMHPHLPWAVWNSPGV